MNEKALVVAGPSALTTTDELASAAAYARASMAPATSDAYTSDLVDFMRWGDARNVDTMPASVETVAAYLAHLADRGLKASTITRRCAAIAYAHRLRGAPPPTAAEPVKAVLRGIRRQLGTAVERKAPATARALSKMIAKIPPTRKGIRDRALLLLGFAAALRRSELASLRDEDVAIGPEGMRLQIRRSKTDQEGEGQEIAIPRGKRLKVIEALEAWLDVRGLTSGSLFGVCDRTVAETVKRYARRAGLDPETFAGHSLRAGFVTSALEKGADLFKVMDVTRHRSVQTLRGYDRRAQVFKNHAGKDFL